MTKEEALKKLRSKVKLLEQDCADLRICLSFAEEGNFKAMADYASCEMDTCQRDKIPLELWPEEYL